MKILIVAIVIILFAAPDYAQKIDYLNGIPGDTSYTLYGTFNKLKKHFPFIEPASAKTIDNVEEIKNIVYAEYGNRRLHLDIFTPKNISFKAGLFLPAVLFIHGGGWSSGTREMLQPMAKLLASKGYAAITAEYRLSPEAKYPAAIYDLKAAVRWMHANASKYKIDSNKIAVYGCSAGGHLAAFIGATNGIKKFEGSGGNQDHSSIVQAVIDIDGILDFTTPAESGHDDNSAKPSAGKKWLGASIKENSGIWVEASPVHYAGENTPPMLFINSSLPRFHAGRDSVIKILNSFHIYTEVHTIPNSPHAFWLFHPWFDQTFRWTIDFLNKTFKVN
jgi:acetyl esterase/lipase